MDDSRIRELTEEVLGRLHGQGEAEPGSGGLASRVSALEQAVRRLERSAPQPHAPASAPEALTAVVVQSGAHPSLHVLKVPGGTDRCLLEPDRPCVKSQACRSLGF